MHFEVACYERNLAEAQEYIIAVPSQDLDVFIDKKKNNFVNVALFLYIHPNWQVFASDNRI